MKVILWLVLPPVGAFAQLPTPNYSINLGNTLEPPCGEGCWGPPASQGLINGFASAGFNTVRIPCAWDSHANQSTHQIDPVFMARVKQVVDWCLATNLHVVINCHWDGGWLENNITDTVNPTINAKMDSYWTQIAAAFIDYDDRVLFAGANEPNCDTAAEWNTLRTYLNTFISAVRSTGDNNSSRWLVFQGPNTDIDLTDALVNTNNMPTDPTPGRLMAEVHFYSPYQFTLMTEDQSWGYMFYFWGQGYHSATNTIRNATWGEEAYVDAQFQKMKTKFMDQGIPVLLGEFGSTRRGSLTGADLDLHLASRTYFHKYVADSARSHGLYPAYWETPGGNIDWNTGAIVDQGNVTALTGGPAIPPPGSGPPSVPVGLTATVASSNQVNLSWTASIGAESYIVRRSLTSGGGYTDVASGVTATSYSDTGLVSGTTYHYVVAASNSHGLSSNSAAAHATPALPVSLPWQSQDIGAVGIGGSAYYGGGVFTVNGAGGDIQGSADAFRFVHLPVTGDGTIVARVASVQNIDAWSKAGVMIRSSLNANAANAFVGVTPANGVTWQYRSSTGGGTTWNNTNGLVAPFWVRLVRSGNTFTGYHSPNGMTWTQQGTATITNMGSTVYVGLALTSHNSGSLCTATFDNVTAPGWPVAPPPVAPAGLAAIAGDGHVELSWSGVPTATDYRVRRSTPSGGGFTTIATNASLSFTNIGVSNGTLYYYAVRAANASGEGDDSAEVSARPTSFTPTQLGFGSAGNQLQLNWPADHTGWQLQTQTNSLAIGIGTNWVTVPDSTETNQFNVTVDPATGTKFFRLVKP